MVDRCFFFGCWNEPGHCLFGPMEGDYNTRHRIEYYGDHVHIDSTLAPRKVKPGTRTWRECGGNSNSDDLIWQGIGKTLDDRMRICYDSDEYPQGEFLLHHLDTGYTAIQWWDRTQGDHRGACNSTVLLDGRHTADEMLAALKEHYPHVLENLTKAGVTLKEVVPETNEAK